MLAEGASANAQAKHSRPNPELMPAIHFALESQYGDKEEACLQIIDLLLKHGADIDASGPDGYGSQKGPFTPLMNAIQQSRVKTVELLINRGANTNVRTMDGRTPFQVCLGARDGKDHWSVQAFLAERSEDGRAWADSPEGKKWLRDRVNDPKAPLGVSPAGAWSDLQQDFTRRQEEIIQWIKSGGDVGWTCASGMTLLHYAAMLDNEKVARCLLAHGAKVNAKASLDMTPLLWACKSLSTSLIPVLLEHGADPNAQTNRDPDTGSSYTALKYIRLRRSNTAEKMEELLISRGAVPLPGTDSPCPECGAPYSAEMAERGVHADINATHAEFYCQQCHARNRIPLDAIDKLKGIMVKCSCDATAYVPPSVWCRGCDGGLSAGWQKQISIGKEAQEAAREFTSPSVKRSRELARELKATHGAMKSILFKSHYPDFEIVFEFSDGKRIHSGAKSGDIIDMFAFGYIGGGPSRLQTFLDEMGLLISADEIEKLKPGTMLEPEQPKRSPEAKAPPSAKASDIDLWRFCLKCKTSDFFVNTTMQKKRWQAGICPYCEGRIIDRATYQIYIKANPPS
jgi:ankyrin repeat protein